MPSKIQQISLGCSGLGCDYRFNEEIDTSLTQGDYVHLSKDNKGYPNYQCALMGFSPIFKVTFLFI